MDLLGPWRFTMQWFYSKGLPNLDSGGDNKVFTCPYECSNHLQKRAQNAFILDLVVYLASQALPNTSVKIVTFVRNAFVFGKIDFFRQCFRFRDGRISTSE